jgi:hypothetical protein
MCKAGDNDLPWLKDIAGVFHVKELVVASGRYSILNVPAANVDGTVFRIFLGILTALGCGIAIALVAITSRCCSLDGSFDETVIRDIVVWVVRLDPRLGFRVPDQKLLSDFKMDY